MLEPDSHPDPNQRVLVFKCTICQRIETAEEGNEFDNCVYRTDLEAKASQLIINEDIVDDPTLQKRNVDKCKNPRGNCPGKEVVTFYHITQDKFELIYVCTTCGQPSRVRERDPNYDIASESDEEDKKK